MDNHADNLIVNYIAGLVDSDFGVYINRFFPRGKLQLKPQIYFVNTRFDIIEFVSEFLHAHNINHHVGYKKATVGKDKKDVLIQRAIMCIPFIDVVEKYCVVRREQLKLLHEFCNSRLYQVNELGWKQNNTPYTLEQISMYEKMVKLNLNYNVDYGYRNYTLSWLSGFLDGDGSVCFSVSKGRIIPCVDFTTGSDTALNNIKEILHRYDIEYDIRTTKSKATKRLGRNKEKFIYNITIKSLLHLYKLLGLLKDKVVSKQKQINLMLNYLELKNNSNVNTEEIWNIVKKVKELNNNYQHISETNTQDVCKNEDRVQPL